MTVCPEQIREWNLLSFDDRGKEVKEVKEWNGMVEKVKKETRFRRSLFPSVGGYPLVLERGNPNEGASLKLLPAKLRSSPTTNLFFWLAYQCFT